MRLFTLLTIALTLLIGEVEANKKFFRIYDLMEVKYSEHTSLKPLDGIGNIAAVYNSWHDDIKILKQGLFQSDRDYLQTILHELAHWAGGREYRAHRHIDDTYIEEVIAENVALKLSTKLFGGRYADSVENVLHYLTSHPTYRPLNDPELALIDACVRNTYMFLIKDLKRVDVNNELGLR